MGLRSLPQLLIQTVDALTSLRPRVLTIGNNLTLTDNADGSATIAASGGSSFVGARVTLTAPLTLTNNVAADVSWGSATFDTASLWSGGSPTRLTVPAEKTGYWHVSGQINWAAYSASKDVYAELHVNGSYSQALLDVYGYGTSAGPITVFGTTLHLTAGDYLELSLAQGTGGDLTVSQGDDSTVLIAEFAGG